MAIIQPTFTGVPDQDAREGWLIQWGPMADGDVGAAISEQSQVAGHADRSVQVEGTFGAGGNVATEGSNDNQNFEVLNDPSLTPLNFTSPKIRAILETVRQIRPHVTAGDGTTSVTVSIFMRKLR